MKQTCLGGCTVKLEFERLKKILDLIEISDDDFNNEDCSIYPIDDENFIVDSLDFFPMISDDLFTFGQITACNSISDIYAMGAKPINALNILAVTKEMTDEEIAEVIRGVKDILKKDNIPLKGGHTIISEDLLCGLSVSGMVNKKNIKLNNSANDGDLVVISKPIGFGTLISAKSVNEVSEKDYAEAIKWMTTSNRHACELVVKSKATSCTDVTGFGLAGHLSEMMTGTENSFELNVSNFPIVGNAIDYLNNYFLTGAGASNRRNYGNKVEMDQGLSFGQEEIIFDPQTSGGLLFTVSENNFEKIKDEKNLWVIGKVIADKKNKIYLRGKK